MKLPSSLLHNLFQFVILLSGLSAAIAGELPCSLPSGLADKAVILSPGHPDYDKADVAAAIQPEGQGGISAGLVVKITSDLPVYRMWNGPDKKNAQGFTNRIGQWWGFEAPAGSQDEYRRNYDICKDWNDLTWMASCTLKAGSVVAVGPGQSVSAESCGDPTGQEHYPANPGHWQVWVSKAWSRGAELVCPPDSEDYKADPADIAQAL
jgi:hypothetical protein